MTNAEEDRTKDDFSTVSLDMKRTLKPDQRNVTLKTQIASINAQIATLQIYHKKLGAQNKHLQTFKLKLQSKFNKTKGQISKLITM